MKTLAMPAETSDARKHFDVLDGLRGVAALSVVVFHFMEWIREPSKNFIGHGFLAVDFFFCLSGFVIGYAYDHRMKAMGLKAFFKARLIRLHPLVVIGSLLGLIGLFLDPFADEAAAYSTGQIVLLFLSAICMIPYPVMADRAFNLFGLNAPSWSLFWEYVANVVYALILHRIGKWLLIVLTAIAAGGIVWVSWRAGNLLGGWSKDTFWDGGVRVAYSFLAGLLIYRGGWIIKNKLGFIMLSILVAAAFMMPLFTTINWVAEALIVLFYFPLIVSLGAGTVLAPKLEAVCVWSGKLSYPLYMTHYWALWIFGHYFLQEKPGTQELVLVIIGGTIALVGLAFFVERFGDAKVRQYLREKLSV